jgi:TonB family protein
MFNNLIESSSHLREFKRRGSFVLFTTATYAVLFIVAGVVSIYAYDARLEDQNTEFVTMLSPMELPAQRASVTHDTPPKNTHSSSAVQTFREPPTISINHPDLVPTGISAEPNKNPSVPDGTPFAVTGVDSGTIDPGGLGRTTTGGNGNTNNTGPGSLVKIDTPPPPQPPIEKHAARTISKGPITGLAKSLPKPAYPPLALQIKAHGAVNVQVLIDESGKVVSARAVTGHPLLMAAAQQAAYRAVFSPTTLGEQPVKVSGVITYNFILP